MPSLIYNYSNWWRWEDYPNQKVTFDKYTKTIIVNRGVTELNVKIDIYSAWKEWVLFSPEDPVPAAFPEAISAIGGEPLTDVLNVGSTFFLENGWRIQPFAEPGQPYVLTVDGNIYTREAGGNPFLFAEGVSVNLTRSNLVDQVVASSTIREGDINTIAARVWEQTSSGSSNGTYGGLVNNLDSDLSSVDIERVNKGLTKGEFLALK